MNWIEKIALVGLLIILLMPLNEKTVSILDAGILVIVGVIFAVGHRIKEE